MPSDEFAAQFEGFLREQGLRLTKQRAQILRSIYGTHRHVSAEQLYDLVKQADKDDALRISRATVYRTLTLLEEGGFVERLDVPNQQGSLYEHTLGHSHHDHMICLSCGKILEFADERLEQVQHEVIASHGFVAKSHRLNVYGHCARCLARAGDGATSPEAAAG
ncbi:MAG: transcriptional repressor [Planctomycetota bacterium]|nr:MAG: transcriptional repressor [Planctomycetota bacterium]